MKYSVRKWSDEINEESKEKFTASRKSPIDLQDSDKLLAQAEAERKVKLYEKH